MIKIRVFDVCVAPHVRDRVKSAMLLLALLQFKEKGGSPIYGNKSEMGTSR